jgi:hypothetical protein
MGYEGNGVAGALRWKDLALDQLLPVDEEKELALKEAEARKMASGTNSNPQGQPATLNDETLEEGESEDEEGDSEDENDENEEDEDEVEERDEWEVR